MSLTDVLWFSWRNLRANRLRTVLILLGLSIGIAQMVILMSLGLGISRLTNPNAKSNTSTILNIQSSETAQGIDSQLESKIAKLDHVLSVRGSVEEEGSATYHDRGVATSIQGIEVDYMDFESTELMEGAWPKKGQAVVSRGLLNRLGTSQDDIVNQFIRIQLDPSSQPVASQAINLFVAGVADESAVTLWMAYDDVIVPVDKSFIKPFETLKIRLTTSKAAEAVSQEIKGFGYTAKPILDAQDERGALLTLLQSVRDNISVTAFIIIGLIFLIGVFTMLTLVLTGRNREVGIMKSVGGRDWDIIKLFSAESLLLSLLGSGTGVLLAFVLTLAIKHIGLLVPNGALQQTYFVYSPKLILASILFSVAIAIVTGFYSAILVARSSKLLQPAPR